MPVNVHRPQTAKCAAGHSHKSSHMGVVAMRRRPVNGRKDELLKQPGADLQDAAAGLLPG